MVKLRLTRTTAAPTTTIPFPSNSSQPRYCKAAAEPKKEVIKKSLWKAIRRCAVHVVPVTLSAAILYTNIKGHYVGTSFASPIKSETINLLFLQIGAKIQELLIIASLTTIVFQLARHELLRGDGLPLGLLGSGILFSNFGYFFTREFVGSLSYDVRWWKKVRFLGFLITAGLIAALAGPSSAILLVPNKQDVSSGGTDFYLNGTFDDFWPIDLNDSIAQSQSYCAMENGSFYATCPSGGFRSLWEHFGHSTFSNVNTTSAQPYSKLISGASFWWPIDSPLSLVPKLYTLGSAHTNDEIHTNTFLIQTHAATAIMTQQILTDWWSSLLMKRKRSADSIDDRRAQSLSLSSAAQVRCTVPRNSTAADKEVEFFSVFPAPAPWGSPTLLVVPTLVNTSVDHPRFQWVHLPERFGHASIGGVFQSPWAADNSSRVVIGCTVQSNWVNTTIFSDEYTFWTGWYPWNVNFDSPYPPYVPVSPGSSLSPTNGRVAVSTSWLQMLTPRTPIGGPGYYSWQPSTIESILMNAGFAEPVIPNSNSTIAAEWLKGDITGTFRTGLLEAIICSVFGDGLARSGSYKLYNTNDRLSKWTLATYAKKQDFTTQILAGRSALLPPAQDGHYLTRRVDMDVSGYAYHADLTEKLAMVTLTLHMILAILHVIWMLWSSGTSDSWDSVSKLVALAQNSRPASHALNNTGAGIKHLHTYAKIANVRSISDANSLSGEHVELYFKDDKTSRRQRLDHGHGSEDLESGVVERRSEMTTGDQNLRDENNMGVALETETPAEITQHAAATSQEPWLETQRRTPATWPMIHFRDISRGSKDSDNTLSRDDSAMNLLESEISAGGEEVETARIIVVGAKYG